MNSLTHDQIHSIIGLIEQNQFLDEEAEYWDEIISYLHQEMVKLRSNGEVVLDGLVVLSPQRMEVL